MQLIRKGPGVRHANAAIATEVYETLDATHGNSAQAKSLRAILTRAETRFTAKMAKIAARQAENDGENSEAAEEAAPAPKARKARKPRAPKVEAQPEAEAEDDPVLDAPFCRPCVSKIVGDVEAHLDGAAHKAAVDALANVR